MNNLTEALAEFQQKVPFVFKGQTGSTGKRDYNYAGLGDIYTTIKPHLKSCGLLLNQWTAEDKVFSEVVHIATGEKRESSLPLLPNVNLMGMNPYQVLGSAITYLRKYTAATVLGLVMDEDEDACGRYDNGYRDKRINPEAYGEELLQEVSKAIAAIHKSIGEPGLPIPYEDLKDMELHEMKEEFDKYQAKELEVNSIPWMEKQLTMQKNIKSVEAFTALKNDAKKRQFFNDKTKEMMNEKYIELFGGE